MFKMFNSQFFVYESSWNGQDIMLLSAASFKCGFSRIISHDRGIQIALTPSLGRAFLKGLSCFCVFTKIWNVLSGRAKVLSLRTKSYVLHSSVLDTFFASRAKNFLSSFLPAPKISSLDFQLQCDDNWSCCLRSWTTPGIASRFE